MAKDWTKIQQKYKGLWVALQKDEVTVISAANSLKQAALEANKKGFKDVVSSLIIAAGLFAMSVPSYSESMTERSGERQGARDTKQSGREQARDVKAACKEGDNSRPECRQKKRDVKQGSRETARDIKRN